MRVFGLTGGIATGKSTVARRLAHHGIPVIDADRVSRRVVEPGQPTLDAIVQAFGSEVLSAEGALDRAAMRQRIIDDPQARKQLEAITHPAIALAIAERLRELAGEGHHLAFVDAALMIETGSFRQYAGVVVVSCGPETQLTRLEARDGMTPDRARALIATQLPLADKEAVADVVIRNDGTLEALHARVDALVNELGHPLRRD